jgi:hypothetical protein
MKKITKRERFESLLSLSQIQADPGMVEFINHELELLAKKNSSEKKPTAQQVANEAIKQAIIDGMERDHLYTITDIQKNIPECAELSNQKISALVRQLKDDNVVVKTEDKRKSYFSLA